MAVRFASSRSRWPDSCSPDRSALAALAPLRGFYEIALIMSLGLLLDAFLVRTMLVPALIIIVGEHSGWPGKRLTQPTPRTDRT